MNIYHYHPETGEYLWAGIASESPRQPGVFLIPAFATDIAPPAPSEGFVLRFVDGAWGYSPVSVPDAPPVATPTPTPAMVVAERERRLALGFDYDFGDGRGTHHIGTTPDDIRKWMDEVTPLAQAFVNGGQQAGEITIATETGIAVITAAEWQAILIAAGGYRQPLYSASFALQAMDPIPLDYADDSYWP